MKTNINLPSGVKISISARFIEFDQPAWDDKEWHPHFRISVRANNHTHTFDYWGSVMDYRANKQELSEFDLLDSVACLFADACMYDANREFEEFAAECGYTKISDYKFAMNAYKECKRADAACRRLFGNGYGSVHSELEEYMSNL